MDQRPITSLLLKVLTILKRYVYFRDSSYYLVRSLYILFTYMFKLFDSLPYGLKPGPFGTGKTSLLQILKLLCYRALPATSISPAAFYRVPIQAEDFCEIVSARHLKSSLVITSKRALLRTGSRCFPIP